MHEQNILIMCTKNHLFRFKYCFGFKKLFPLIPVQTVANKITIRASCADFQFDKLNTTKTSVNIVTVFEIFYYAIPHVIDCRVFRCGLTNAGALDERDTNR